jgi:hypothetical protein
MAKEEKVEQVPAPDAESDADSEAYTKEREEAAERHLEESQELARVNFQFVGVPEPEVEIPSPEDRPLDLDSMSEAEVEALETQNAIASEDYTPKTFDDFVSETFESPDINPEAKEFQLKKGEPADEFVGPEAAAEAAETGVNPRSAATASDREGMLQETPEAMAPVSENAEPVATGEAPDPETKKVLDD